MFFLSQTGWRLRSSQNHEFNAAAYAMHAQHDPKTDNYMNLSVILCVYIYKFKTVVSKRNALGVPSSMILAEYRVNHARHALPAVSPATPS